MYTVGLLNSRFIAHCRVFFCLTEDTHSVQETRNSWSSFSLYWSYHVWTYFLKRTWIVMLSTNAICFLGCFFFAHQGNKIILIGPKLILKKYMRITRFSAIIHAVTHATSVRYHIFVAFNTSSHWHQNVLVFSPTFPTAAVTLILY